MSRTTDFDPLGQHDLPLIVGLCHVQRTLTRWDQPTSKTVWPYLSKHSLRVGWRNFFPLSPYLECTLRTCKERTRVNTPVQIFFFNPPDHIILAILATNIGVMVGRLPPPPLVHADMHSLQTSPAPSDLHCHCCTAAAFLVAPPLLLLPRRRYFCCRTAATFLAAQLPLPSLPRGCRCLPRCAAAAAFLTHSLQTSPAPSDLHCHCCTAAAFLVAPLLPSLLWHCYLPCRVAAAAFLATRPPLPSLLRSRRCLPCRAVSSEG